MEYFIFCVVYEFGKIQGYLFYFLTTNVEILWQNFLPRCSYAIPWIVLSAQPMLSSIMACDRLNPNIDCKDCRQICTILKNVQIFFVQTMRKHLKIFWTWFRVITKNFNK